MANALFITKEKGTAVQKERISKFSLFGLIWLIIASVLSIGCLLTTILITFGVPETIPINLASQDVIDQQVLLNLVISAVVFVVLIILAAGLSYLSRKARKMGIMGTNRVFITLSAVLISIFIIAQFFVCVYNGLICAIDVVAKMNIDSLGIEVEGINLGDLLGEVADDAKAGILSVLADICRYMDGYFISIINGTAFLNGGTPLIEQPVAG